jgi:hypothetical protein
MQMLNRFFLFAAGALASCLCGCASVSLSERNWTEPKPDAPERIYVRPFEVETGDLRVDRQGDELLGFKRQFSEEFANRLAERLSKYIVPSEVLNPSAALPEGRVWIVQGRFIRLHQGSRALRSLVGFGLGKTRTDAVVEIFRPGKKGRLLPVASFSTTGGSNAEPGALFSSPFGVVPRLASQAAGSGLSADARRTARTITAAISEKLHEGGAELAGRPLRAKPLGGLPGDM